MMSRNASRFKVVFRASFIVAVVFVFCCSDCGACGRQVQTDQQSKSESSSLIRPANLWDESREAKDQPFAVVLGIAQDGGFPQAGCKKECCRDHDASAIEGPSCIAVVDPTSQQRWLFECTPQFPSQLSTLDATFPGKDGIGLSGIFLTHAHIGHYAGLIHLGREVMGAKAVPVYAMPRMRNFLTTNGPWSQLVALENIELHQLESGTAVQLNERIKVTPLLVPHRDEFSETVGYLIEGPNHAALFLPDIDKWERWESKIETYVQKVDVAFLDATFFDGDELPGRVMSEIPHPFIKESIQRFAALDSKHRSKIAFIHLNHSNPALKIDSAASKAIDRAGMSVARTSQRFGL